MRDHTPQIKHTPGAKKVIIIVLEKNKTKVKSQIFIYCFFVLEGRYRKNTKKLSKTEFLQPRKNKLRD